MKTWFRVSSSANRDSIRVYGFEDQMIDNGSGFFYFPGRIPAGQVSPTEWPQPESAPAANP